VLWAMGLLFRGHFFINAVSWVDIVHWMWRWWLFYQDISSLLYLYVSIIFLGIQSFGASGQLKNSRGVFTLRAPRTMGLYVFPPWMFTHMSNLDWCANGHFSILGLGPWALCCVRILPSHNIYFFLEENIALFWWKILCKYSFSCFQVFGSIKKMS